MRVGILLADHTPPDLVEQHGDFDHHIECLLADRDLQFVSYPVVDNEFPGSPTCCDAWIVTGSTYSANDALEWIARLKEFVRAVRVANRPLVGICFGHQLIASAFGGAVAKSEDGWTVGPVRYRRTDTGADVVLNACHKEEVVAVSSDAIVLGTSDGCIHAIVAYGDRVLTYQAHPELTTEYIRDVVAHDERIVLSKGRELCADHEGDTTLTVAQAADEIYSVLVTPLHSNVSAPA